MEPAQDCTTWEGVIGLKILFQASLPSIRIAIAVPRAVDVDLGGTYSEIAVLWDSQSLRCRRRNWCTAGFGARAERGRQDRSPIGGTRQRPGDENAETDPSSHAPSVC